MNAWRVRQFAYQWLRAPVAQYVDFTQTTQDKLVCASKETKLDDALAQREQLMVA